jgi:citrate synthase
MIITTTFYYKTRLCSSSKKIHLKKVNLSILKNRLLELIPIKQKEIAEVKQKYGEKILGTCTVNQAYGGMRSVKSLITETSLLDPEEGIRFRGLSIPECQQKLPKASGGNEPLPEGLLWLLMTGEIPTSAQVAELSKDLASREKIPDWVFNLLKSLPKTMHPMTQFNIAINSLQPESLFAKAYQEGVPKSKYWETTFEDSLNLIAKLPGIASAIYRNSYKDGKLIKYDPNLDWGANFAKMLGYNDPTFAELMRLYLTIHSDHEGGNVSAHATHLVGSALSDPYISYSAGMSGLAGPLHGLANQEVLRWTMNLKKKLGDKPVSNQELEKV